MLLGSSCDQSQVDNLANSIVRKAQNIYIVFYILGNAQKSKRVKKALQKKEKNTPFKTWKSQHLCRRKLIIQRKISQISISLSQVSTNWKWKKNKNQKLISLTLKSLTLLERESVCVCDTDF